MSSSSVPRRPPGMGHPRGQHETHDAQRWCGDALGLRTAELEGFLTPAADGFGEALVGPRARPRAPARTTSRIGSVMTSTSSSSPERGVQPGCVSRGGSIRFTTRRTAPRLRVAMESSQGPPEACFGIDGIPPCKPRLHAAICPARRANISDHERHVATPRSGPLSLYGWVGEPRARPRLASIRGYPAGWERAGVRGSGGALFAGRPPHPSPLPPPGGRGDQIALPRGGARGSEGAAERSLCLNGRSPLRSR